MAAMMRRPSVPCRMLVLAVCAATLLASRSQAQQPVSCRANTDCRKAEYCQLGSDCGAASPGVCTPRPPSCNERPPTVIVCGCDGQRYGSACRAASAGISVLGPQVAGGRCRATAAPGLAEQITATGVADCRTTQQPPPQPSPNFSASFAVDRYGGNSCRFAGGDLFFQLHAQRARDDSFLGLLIRGYAGPRAYQTSFQGSSVSISVPIPQNGQLASGSFQALTTETATGPQCTIVVGGNDLDTIAPGANTLVPFVISCPQLQVSGDRQLICSMTPARWNIVARCIKP